MRLADVVYIPQKARVELIHRHLSQNLCIAQREHLRLPDSQGIETWYAGAALSARIWVIEPVIVDEIIRRKLAPGRIGIHPPRSLVVPHRFGKRRRREKIRSDIRRRNVLQKL